jgi:hypothetical protein
MEQIIFNECLSIKSEVLHFISREARKDRKELVFFLCEPAFAEAAPRRLGAFA